SAEQKTLKGVYSNLARVTFTKNEFVLGFVFTFGEEAHLVSRVVVSPQHMKNLKKVITNSLEEYEKEFGKND
ncbi:MAG: DUF3467 domain-containing protein, partial [Balneolaceae bacterium]